MMNEKQDYKKMQRKSNFEEENILHLNIEKYFLFQARDMEYKSNVEELKKKMSMLEIRLREKDEEMDSRKKEVEEEITARVERVLKAKAILQTEVGLAGL